MRPITNFTLHSVLAVALIAFGATGGAAAVDSLKLLATVNHGVASGGKEIQVESFSWGATRTAGDPDRPVVAGRIPNPGVEREMKESGEKGGTEDMNIGVGELQEATAKRQHKPMTITKEWDARSAPLPAGSMTALVPAGTCKVGARYPMAELGTGGKRYKMTDVVVTSCAAASSGGDRPMEQLSLNYAKIVWR